MVLFFLPWRHPAVRCTSQRALMQSLCSQSPASFPPHQAPPQVMLTSPHQTPAFRTTLEALTARLKKPKAKHTHFRKPGTQYRFRTCYIWFSWLITYVIFQRCIERSSRHQHQFLVQSKLSTSPFLGLLKIKNELDGSRCRIQRIHEFKSCKHTWPVTQHGSRRRQQQPRATEISQIVLQLQGNASRWNIWTVRKNWVP